MKNIQKHRVAISQRADLVPVASGASQMYWD